MAPCQINRIDLNFHLQKYLEIFDKNSADKIQFKNYKEVNPPCLMPIKVNLKNITLCSPFLRVPLNPKSCHVMYEWYLLIPAKLATFPRFGVNDAKLQTTLLTFANKFFVGIILHWPPKKGTTAGAASASVVVVPSSFIRTNWAQFEAGLAFKHRGYSE